MVAFKLLIAFAVAAAFVPSLDAADTCECMAAQSETVSPTSQPSLVVYGPSINAQGGVSCAKTCSTVGTINGALSSGPPGIQISILLSTALNATNYFTIVGGSVTQTIQSASTIISPITDSNTVNITFHFTTSDAEVTLYLTPIPQTTPPTTTAPSASTPAYNGPYPVNPATVNLDLIIGLDIASSNKALLNNALPSIKEIVNTFSYSDDTVRLSLFFFNPVLGGVEIGFGSTLPWSLNATTFNASTSFIPYVTGTNSDYFSQLNDKLFNGLADPNGFRDNTERILLIFTGNDAATPSTTVSGSVVHNLTSSELKIVVANIDTTKQFGTTYFPNLNSLTDTKLVSSFDYLDNGQNNAQELLKTVIFNGNAIGQQKNNDGNDDGDFTEVPDRVPIDNFKYYNILTNYKRTYKAIASKPWIQLSFNYYDTNVNKDFIRITNGGNTITTLTGQGYGFYLCQNVTDSLVVSFESSAGKVYGGYQSNAVASAENTTCLAKPHTFGVMGRIMKYLDV
uniref:VWFA domain-containing protein n=1 Tax=Panagrellus redivivus TaxID=6233 RepID=A0A7E4W308_PANRE